MILEERCLFCRNWITVCQDCPWQGHGIRDDFRIVISHAWVWRDLFDSCKASFISIWFWKSSFFLLVGLRYLWPLNLTWQKILEQVPRDSETCRTLTNKLGRSLASGRISTCSSWWWPSNRPFSVTNEHMILHAARMSTFMLTRLKLWGDFIWDAVSTEFRSSTNCPEQDLNYRTTGYSCTVSPVAKLRSWL